MAESVRTRAPAQSPEPTASPSPGKLPLQLLDLRCGIDGVQVQLGQIYSVAVAAQALFANDNDGSARALFGVIEQLAADDSFLHVANVALKVLEQAHNVESAPHG